MTSQALEPGKVILLDVVAPNGVEIVTLTLHADGQVSWIGALTRSGNYVPETVFKPS